MDGRRHVFRTSAELDAVLRLRTDVSPDVIKGLSRRSEHELRQELRDTTVIHKTLLGQFLRVMEDGDRYSLIWDELDIGTLPEDHHWQSLLFALGDEERVGDAFRRVAMIKYLQYLSARREVIDDLIREIRRHGSLVSVRHEDDEHHTLRKESLPDQKRDYRRLPKSGTVILRLPENEDVGIYLGRHKVCLRLKGEKITISDDDQLKRVLPPGKYLLGRSQGCDVMFSGAVREVSQISRRHLQLELDSDGELRLKDLSSCGTFIPRSLKFTKPTASTGGLIDVHAKDGGTTLK